MSTGALALPVVPARTDRRTVWIAAVIAAAALIIRAPQFGDPALAIDEQFYLLVGDRMLHGAIPYVDIWDRKPIGLFLIYAFCRLLGGDGFVQYQLVATAFAAATAIVIQRIARPVAGEVAALVAAILYLIWIELPEGGGGQAPVFYNLLVAAAGLLVLRALEDGAPARARGAGFAAMALVGLAIQIKYSVVVEGLFFGLVLATAAWRRAATAGEAVVEAAALALTAWLPTLVALACYAAAGHARDFCFANFGSILLRGAGADPAELATRIGQAMLRLVPLTVAAAVGAWTLRDDRRAATRRWQIVIGGWMLAAFAGFFSVGVYYGHYLLPAFVPFTAAAAPALQRRPIGWVLAALLVWLPLPHLDYPDLATTARHRREIAGLTALVPRDVTRTCMEMFDGPPILAFTTRACALSRYVFPDHLSAAIEANAIGVDPRGELARVMRQRPGVVTISDVDVRPPNPATFALMRSWLRRDYVLRGRAPLDGRLIDVWVHR